MNCISLSRSHHTMQIIYDKCFWTVAFFIHLYSTGVDFFEIAAAAALSTAGCCHWWSCRDLSEHLCDFLYYTIVMGTLSAWLRESAFVMMREIYCFRTLFSTLHTLWESQTDLGRTVWNCLFLIISDPKRMIYCPEMYTGRTNKVIF